MLELIFSGGMSCSTLMQGRGIWSCPNLMCQTLLTLHGSPYSLGRVDGVVDLGEGGLGRGVGEELQLKYKMKFKRMYVILKKERETTHTHTQKRIRCIIMFNLLMVTALTKYLHMHGNRWAVLSSFC